jgi:hypothetical protein
MKACIGTGETLYNSERISVSINPKMKTSTMLYQGVGGAHSTYDSKDNITLLQERSSALGHTLKGGKCK